MRPATGRLKSWQLLVAVHDRGEIKSMLKITTKTVGWQKRCWDWVKAGELFELHGVEAAHLFFCQALGAAYEYDYRFPTPAVLVFTPKNAAVAATPRPSRQFDANAHKREGFITSGRSP